MSITRRDVGIILLLFALTRVFLVSVGAWANVNLPANEGDEFKHLLDGGPALDMWYRWDAGFYTSIATYGYDWYNEQRPAEDMAFLPLYPAAVRGVMAVSGCGFSPYLSTCATVAGLVVSNAALLGASFLLYDLVQRREDRATALRAVALLLLAPGMIFFSGVYTESLFLLLVLATFWLLARGRFGWAVAAACLAALTRSVGVALYPALLWNAWFGTQSARARPLRIVLAHLPLVAFGSYVLYSGVTAGEPLAYFRSYEVIWGRDVTRAPWETLLAYFSGEPVSWFGWELSWIDLAAFVACIGLSIAALRRDRAWGLYALCATLIPFMSGTLVGMPRFAIVIFPFYIILAAWLRRPWQMALASAAAAGLALLFVTRFVAWRWIA